MTREKLFDLWAPLGGQWSDWVKPVLFAQIPRRWTHEATGARLPALELDGITLTGGTAVVIDLPGDASVSAAIALLHKGYRPVPLFNGAPDAAEPPIADVDSPAVSYRASLNLWPLMRALWLGAEELIHTPPPPDAPPAFLLDSRRRTGDRTPMPGMIDNRWITFPTDFPSARVLLDRGISRAVVITGSATEPATDLSHTLLRWQQAGIEIQLLQIDGDRQARPITVRQPNRFRTAWYQFTTALGFRRSMLGGFGGHVPQPSSGG